MADKMRKKVVARTSNKKSKSLNQKNNKTIKRLPHEVGKKRGTSSRSV